jgi:hypothetical protein
LYFDLKRDQGYETLKKLASKLISTMIDQGVLTKEQLSHVIFDPASQLYLVDFHLTVVSGQKTFNGTAVLEKFKDTALGTMSLNQIHLSNR